MNDILTVSALNKSQGDFSLKDVTFSLPEGCITGFIGVNGAGKTTTLRTILGLTDKLSGNIQFFGLDPLIRNQLLKTLTQYMKNGGKGVFFSTHITSDLDKIADMLIMIDNGRIIFQEDKDTLLDMYRIVKGDCRFLTDDVRKLLLSVSETDFGFTGITNQISKVRSYIPEIIVERPTIEDIMLVNVGGEK